MSSATFYKWRAKYGGMDSSMIARLKELEAENARLKKMYAEERIKAEILKEAIEKRGRAILPAGTGGKNRLAPIKPAFAFMAGPLDPPKVVGPESPTPD